MADSATRVSCREERSESWSPHRTRAIVLRWDVINASRVAIRQCKECTKEYADDRPRHPSDFCCKAHQVAFKNRRQKRGLAIIDDAMRYRRFRKDKTAFGDLCAKISAFIDEDKANGRPSF